MDMSSPAFLIPDGDDDIELPLGYEPIELWRRNHPGCEPDPALVRWLPSAEAVIYFGDGDDAEGIALSTRERLEFVLDPENPSLKAFQAECARDSKNLNSAFERAFKARDLPLSVRGKNRARAWLNFSFLINPPFLKSDVPKNSDNRIHPGEHELVFHIHVDPDRRLQAIRTHFSKSFSLTELRKKVFSFLQDWFNDSSHYGDWDNLSNLLVDLVFEVIEPELNDDVLDLEALKNCFKFPGLMPPKEAIRRFIRSQIAILDPSAIPHFKAIYLPMVLSILREDERHELKSEQIEQLFNVELKNYRDRVKAESFIPRVRSREAA